MHKKRLKEVTRKANNAKFSLPYNIKGRKKLLATGKWCYVFRHDELRELGRIVIIPHGAQSQIFCEVFGNPNDPMTEKRREIFEPISKEITDIMSLNYGESEDCSDKYIESKKGTTC